MMQKYNSKRIGFLVVIAAVAMITSTIASVTREDKVAIDQANPIDRPVTINPDYSKTVIPPNIAPLNFSILEKGSQYCVRIYSKQGKTIEIFSKTPTIVIPEDQWHTLLDYNRGEELFFLIFVKAENGKWNRFTPIINNIANEEIDSVLVYRKIYPAYSAWGKIGIYQRNLYNYDESVILDNDYFEGGCLNCHTFCANNPDKMLFGTRSSKYSSSAILVEDGEARKIGTKFGYTSWHPSGRLAAYSINKVNMFFHTTNTEVRDVIDLDSLLAYYLVDQKVVKTAPDISRKDRLETYPTWSPDGRYLYFCSAPLTWTDKNIIPTDYNEIKYDLVRISYDIDKDEWGKLETVLLSQDTGKTMLLPRISPDGRWLLFCMSDYGCFPVYQRSSDLYIIDLESARQTGQYESRRLSINSDESESWHSWSTNSRWIAFSSKRNSGVFTRSYLCYLDKKGKAYKPFLLPQKDPDYYSRYLRTYSVPELITKPVKVIGEKLGRVVRSSPDILCDMPVTMATPKAAGPAKQDKPWLTDRE